MGLRPVGAGAPIEFTQGRVMATSHQGIIPCPFSHQLWCLGNGGARRVQAHFGRLSLGSTESVQRKEPRSLPSRVNQLVGFGDGLGGVRGRAAAISLNLPEKQVWKVTMAGIAKAWVRILGVGEKGKGDSDEVRPGPHFRCPHQRANALCCSLPDVTGTGAERLPSSCLLRSSPGCPMSYHQCFVPLEAPAAFVHLFCSARSMLGLVSDQDGAHASCSGVHCLNHWTLGSPLAGSW